MSKNEDSAFAMVNLLEPRVGHVITVYLEGGKKLSEVTLVKCKQDEVILRGKKQGDFTQAFYTTPDRIVAFEDPEFNLPEKPEEDEEDEYDPVTDTITPRRKQGTS